MGSSDSLSLPSEPPDVGKWFSSYVYDSPELNTINDFKDFGGSQSADIGNREKVREENFDGKDILKKRDDLPPDVKGISDGFFKCKNLAGGNCSTNEVKEYSDSFALLSEPLDVKNWFSGYTYESPSIDTGFTEIGSNCNKDKFHEDETDATNCTDSTKIQKVDSINLIEKVNKDDLEGQTTTSSVPVKCVNAVGDKDSEQQCFPKDLKKAAGIQNSGRLNHLMTQKISYRILQKKILLDHDLGSAKDIEQPFITAEGSVDKLHGKFNEEANHMLLDMEADIDFRESPQKSIYIREIADESMVARDCRKAIETVLPAKNSEINPVDGKPVKKGTVRHCDKENMDKENGFISTRKTRSKKVNDESSSKRPLLVKSDFVKNEVNKEAITRRVLSETTNFQSSSVLEITGKWRCPQKSKPKLGPPLKQLRLEQWVRRV